MAGHVRAPVNRGDIDVSALFEKYTIDEIRDIEKKTRQDIEKKKEDLRHMVGERYRDLIEAADTITEMKRSSDSVMQSIARMQDLCNNLKQSFASSHRPASYGDKSASKDSQRKMQQKLLCSTAVNLKLLMDMPERIWSALDTGNYLLSTRLYLLARHVYSTVQLDPQSAHVIAHFPLLSRQWTTICHFRTTILQTCRTRLKQASVTDEEVSECLCSILLLEDFTSEQVFNEFLTVRLDAVRQLFRADSADNSVRSQVSSVISLIVTSIHQIFTIFHTDEALANDTEKQVPCNLLVTMLKQVTSKSVAGSILSLEDISIPSQKYLSKSIIDFRPTTRHQLVGVPSATVRTASQQFLASCMKNVQDGLVKLLGFVTSVRGLTAVRDELWNQLKQDTRLSTWDVVCSHVLGRQLHVWTELASEIFVARVEELLQGQFDATVTAGKTQINKVLADLMAADDRQMQHERDLSGYVWTESSQDMPAGQMWSAPSVSSGRSFSDQGSALVMKARGYTPAVQSLCRTLDQRFKMLLDDANHYVRPQPTGQPATMPTSPGQPTVAVGDEPFDRFADKKRIHEFVQNACESCVTKQLEHLRLQLEENRKQLEKTEDGAAGSQLVIYRILLLGRFTSALCELSPNLQLCMCCQLGDDMPPAAVSRLLSRKTPLTSRTLSKTVENTRWCQMRESLVRFSNDAYGIWTAHISELLVARFKKFLNDRSGSGILKSGTQWDCVEIEEETEDSKMVKSTIRVPMQASWYVQTLLYNLCEDINRIGGQTMPVSSLTSLVQSLCDGVLTAYNELLSQDSLKPTASPEAMTQTRALQLLFDVRFLMNVLGHREDTETTASPNKRLQKIVEKLESYVDPFDLDVFFPYIQNHLARQTQRSSVLYGSLTSADKRGSVYSAPSTLGTQQEQHNVLPLSSCQNRFPLLPLSIQNRSATSTIQPIVQAPKSKLLNPTMPIVNASGSGTNVLTTNDTVPQRAASSSFLEQMSTIWFSNVGGK